MGLKGVFLEVRGQRSEVRDQRSEIRGQRSEVRAALYSLLSDYCPLKKLF